MFLLLAKVKLFFAIAALSLKQKNQDTVNQAIRELQNGRSNATGSFTLTANATSTTVAFANCSATSVVFPSAQTPDAANDMATLSIVAGKGQFVVTHASNARVDRTFGFAVFGGN